MCHEFIVVRQYKYCIIPCITIKYIQCTISQTVIRSFFYQNSLEKPYTPITLTKTPFFLNSVKRKTRFLFYFLLIFPSLQTSRGWFITVKKRQIKARKVFDIVPLVLREYNVSIDVFQSSKLRITGCSLCHSLINAVEYQLYIYRTDKKKVYDRL